MIGDGDRGEAGPSGMVPTGPDEDDEDSCNMTAVDPTSMLKSEDKLEDEAAGPSAVSIPVAAASSSSKPSTSRGPPEDASKKGLHACVASIRKKHTGKFDALLNLIKTGAYHYWCPFLKKERKVRG